MCNLYRMTNAVDEIARWFDAANQLEGANLSAEVYPGYPGMVVAHGRLHRMTWGFPLVMTGKGGQKLKPKPVNNARTDKLESVFWRSSFEQRRCLIPLTAWAEAEGPRGRMTRAWLSLPGTDVFACAGVWRESDEWGSVYSMVMTDAAGRAAEVHTRMPVVLAPDDQSAWIDGSPADALALCRPWDGALTLDRTNQPWSGGARTQTLLI